MSDLNQVEKKPINGYVDKCIADLVESRAQKIKRTKTAFVSAIVRQWYQNGAKAVDPIDRAVNFDGVLGSGAKTELAEAS